MKKRITALLLLLTLSVTSLFACTSADKSESASDKTAKTSKSTSTKKQELTPVTLNEVAHSIFYAPMYVAIEKGYFANEGIDLSLVTGFGADKTMTAVLSGTADIGFMGSEASIYTYNEGANDYVVNFAQLTQRAGNFLVAREDIKDFKWEDLKGKKVIGGRKGGMPEMVFEYILNQNHIDPATDLTIDQNIDFGSTAAAFAEDKSDYDSYMENYQTTYTEKADDIRAGGYRIYTTLDQSLQQALQTQLDDVLSPYTELQDNGKYALQGAGVIVDNQTGCVAAIVGGRGTTDPYNRAYLSARQPGSTIKPLIDYGPAFDTGEYYPARLVNDHKFEGGPSNSGGSYYGNVSVREALNRSLNTVAWQILTDIGVDYGLNYLREMEFQKLTYIDNGVPSLSIGGFTNGVRVVDMAKGYSTLANGGIYNDQTCIRRIDHEHNGELTKNLKPHTQLVYQQDSAYMLTDVLKGTLNEPYGTGYGLALESGMPAAGKTGTTNSSKDTWFCGYTRYYTTAVWVGYDTPRAMPGIYGKTYAGRIWKQVMDQIHEGKELSDWEQPVTVEMTTDSKSGITDLFSSTLNERAQQSLHDKEQRKLEADLETAVTAFEDKTIETVEDTYWVKEQYQSIISRLNLMDGSEKRTELLERMTKRNEEFTPIINDMKDTIALYEVQKAKEKAEAQKKAEEEAITTRKNLEIQTRKNTFLSALRDVENLEYQSEDAEDIAQNAIDKLSLVESYEEAASYKERLQKAIDRIATLPTEDEWEAEQEKKEEAEVTAQAANEQKIGLEQQSLRNYLSQAKRSWTTWSSQMTDNAGPGIDHNSGTSRFPGSGTTTAPGSGSSQDQQEEEIKR